eukprot:382497_1
MGSTDSNCCGSHPGKQYKKDDPDSQTMHRNRKTNKYNFRNIDPKQASINYRYHYDYNHEMNNLHDTNKQHHHQQPPLGTYSPDTITIHPSINANLSKSKILDIRISIDTNRPQRTTQKQNNDDCTPVNFSDLHWPQQHQTPSSPAPQPQHQLQPHCNIQHPLINSINKPQWIDKSDHDDDTESISQLSEEHNNNVSDTDKENEYDLDNLETLNLNIDDKNDENDQNHLMNTKQKWGKKHIDKHEFEMLKELRRLSVTSITGTSSNTTNNTNLS